MIQLANSSHMIQLADSSHMIQLANNSSGRKCSSESLENDGFIKKIQNKNTHKCDGKELAR